MSVKEKHFWGASSFSSIQAIPGILCKRRFHHQFSCLLNKSTYILIFKIYFNIIRQSASVSKWSASFMLSHWSPVCFSSFLPCVLHIPTYHPPSLDDPKYFGNGRNLWKSLRNSFKPSANPSCTYNVRNTYASSSQHWCRLKAVLHILSERL